MIVCLIAIVCKIYAKTACFSTTERGYIEDTNLNLVEKSSLTSLGQTLLHQISKEAVL